MMLREFLGWEYEVDNTSGSPELRESERGTHRYLTVAFPLETLGMDQQLNPLSNL
jgi:hypothetical protein